MPTLTATSASFGASSVSGHTFTAGSSGSAPAAPTGLVAVGQVAQVVLTWNASVGADTYSVFRGTISGGESGTAIVVGLSGTTYTDTSRLAGTTYYYTVKAVNSSGTSPASIEATVITIAEILTASISPSLKPGDTNKTISLSCNYPVFTAGTPGSPVFTIAKAPTNDAVKNSQSVADTKHGSINVDAGATTGTLTITNPTSGKTAQLTVSLITHRGNNNFSIGLSI